jgi:glutamyl-tRNA synthetase
VALVDSLEARVRRLALENALAHGGAARPGPVLARLLSTDPDLRARSAELGPLVKRLSAEVSALPTEEQRRAFDALGGPEKREARRPTGSEPIELPPLAGAREGRVVLRLAPFPSGAPHLGFLRGLFVNDEYRRRYRGRLLLVVDDTVGSEEKPIQPESYDLLREALEIVRVEPDEFLYKSDRIPRHYVWAERVIGLGAAYVCLCPADRLRELRREGRPCPERDQPVELARAEWKKMLDGSYGPGAAVLRVKSGLTDPDPAFRDRVLLRVSDLDHPRVGRRYRVWPMLEFSWAVDDVELGVTHILRGKELAIEDRMERFLWDLLAIEGPSFLHWGLLRVREAKISKSKSAREVREGIYDGWADPRTWSVQSLDRRGIRPEALRSFVLSFGLSLADIEVPAETLYAENRALIDPTTSRRAFVPEPVRVRIDGYPSGLERVTLPNHPERTELGTRSVSAGPTVYLSRADVVRAGAEEFRLKELVNVRFDQAAAPNGPDAELVARFTSRENKRLPRIQWVGADGAVEVDVLDPDGTHRRGLGEAALGDARPGDLLQFERVGFVRVERDWSAGTRPVRVCYGHP